MHDVLQINFRQLYYILQISWSVYCIMQFKAFKLIKNDLKLLIRATWFELTNDLCLTRTLFDKPEHSYFTCIMYSMWCKKCMDSNFSLVIGDFISVHMHSTVDWFLICLNGSIFMRTSLSGFHVVKYAIYSLMFVFCDGNSNN